LPTKTPKPVGPPSAKSSSQPRFSKSRIKEANTNSKHAKAETEASFFIDEKVGIDGLNHLLFKSFHPKLRDEGATAREEQGRVTRRSRASTKSTVISP